MSFRFTNDLIATFKQKALMSHYTSTFLFPRTFIGRCAGVTAKVNSSCQLLELTVDESAKATFAEATAASAKGSSDVAGTADAVAKAALGTVASANAPVDTAKLAKAVEMAVWDATRKVKAAKEEYYRQSVKHSRLHSAGRELTGEAPEATQTELATIRDFSKYGLSTDAAMLGPHPWDSFRDRGPFHAMLSGPSYASAAAAAAGSSTSASASSSAHLLGKEFAPPRPMTLADVLPEYRAAFLSYPAGAVNATIVDTSAGKAEGAKLTLTTAPAEARAASAAKAAVADRNVAAKEERQIRAAAASEEAKAELAFWTRVEAIRKGQQAVLGASLNKRPYKDQAGAIPVSNFDEKVSLHFIQ